MTDAYTAEVLLELGRGLGFAQAHALLSPSGGWLDEDAEVVRAIRDVGDAFRDEGDAAAADAVEAFVRRVRGQHDRRNDVIDADVVEIAPRAIEP